MRQLLDFDRWITTSDPQGYARKRDELLNGVMAFTVKRDSTGKVKTLKEDVAKVLEPYLSPAAIAGVPFTSATCLFPEQKRDFVASALAAFDEDPENLPRAFRPSSYRLLQPPTDNRGRGLGRRA